MWMFGTTMFSKAWEDPSDSKLRTASSKNPEFLRICYFRAHISVLSSGYVDLMT